MEVLRNLKKDISKQHSINLSESVLASLRSHQQPQSSNGSEVENSNGSKAIATFSCGHAYPLDRFQNQILLGVCGVSSRLSHTHSSDFKTAASSPQTLAVYPSACPHCVFQFLRKFSVLKCPSSHGTFDPLPRKHLANYRTFDTSPWKHLETFDTSPWKQNPQKHELFGTVLHVRRQQYSMYIFAMSTHRYSLLN